jgi:hypothetical protein
MQTDEWIDRLNALSEPSEAAKRPLTPLQLQELFKHPPKKADFDQGTELIASIAQAFATADSNGRLRIVSRLSQNASRALIGYAYKMATDAVRQASPDLVVRGLAALAIEGGRWDIRDSIIPMALLHHSALKLGMDAGKTFEAGASLSTSAPLSQAMRSFPARRPADRGLTAFHFREVVTALGFTYEQIMPSIFPR